MYLNIGCVLVILAVGYSMHNEGLFRAVLMFVNIFLAGFLTYEFWEPCADMLESSVRGTFMAGMEDHLAMIVLFCIFLGTLRYVTNEVAKWDVDINPNLHRYGGALVGLIAGYFLSGFLVCAMETLPLSDKFLGFTPREDNDGMRSLFPPDRVWSSIMFHAGANCLAWKTGKEPGKTGYDRYRTFDPQGTFELRYLRYRRYIDKDGKREPPLTWRGEISDGS